MHESNRRLILHEVENPNLLMSNRQNRNQADLYDVDYMSFNYFDSKRCKLKELEFSPTNLDHCIKHIEHEERVSEMHLRSFVTPGTIHCCNDF